MGITKEEVKNAWKYYKHADIIHSGRINFFLVAESMLLLSFVTILSSNRNFEFIAYAIAIIGILFTISWLYVNAGLFKRMIRLSHDYLVPEEPVYKKYTDELNIKMGAKISAGMILSYYLPLLLIAFWVFLLFQVLKASSLTYGIIVGVVLTICLTIICAINKKESRKMGTRIKENIVNFLKSLCEAYRKIARNLIAALLVAVSLFVLLNLCGYKVDILGSLKNKILGNLVIINSPPKARLFTYYGTEFGLGTTSKIEFIVDGQILSSKKQQRVYVGVYNDEGKSLKQVTFVIKIPAGAKVINEEEIKNFPWIDMDTQYNYFYPRGILPKSGQMLHPPLALELPEGANKIEYQILCEDFLPKKGSFTLKVD